MAVGMTALLRNAMLDAITTKLDAGAGAGTLKIYDGTRPATGGAATTLLATVTLSDPSSPAASGGVLTMSAITSGTGVAASTATWGRFADSNGLFVMDCSVGTSGTDVVLNTATVSVGVTVAVTSSVITAGNP